LPCAPNPTTGFFFYVPQSKILEVEMIVQDAETLIMSCGVVQPGTDPQKNLAALAALADAARLATAPAPTPEPPTVEQLRGAGQAALPDAEHVAFAAQF